MDKIYFAGPSITEHEIQTVEHMLRSGWYENAYDYCEKFQQEFAAYHNRAYGIMTPNCTTAIHLLLTGLGIQEGDEVILPDCTWIATGAGITYLRATPVFADIDPVHWCLDPATLASRITPRTKAVMAVGLFGNMPLMDDVLAIASRHGLPLVEDAAEALGSTYKGRKAGSFGVASVFSFHRTKTITTGEGGMLLLDDPALYERCLFLRDHGRKPDNMYYNYAVTYKYMPSNYQAALGYAQFQRLDELLQLKRDQLRMYRERLSEIEDVAVNPDPVEGVHGGWMTTFIIGRSYPLDKTEMVARLAEMGIPGRPFFYPLSSLPAYPGLRATYEPLNVNCYDIAPRGVNLPCAFSLTEAQIDCICDGVRTVLHNAREKQSAPGR